MGEWLPYEIYYENSGSEIIRFDEPPLLLNTSTLFDFAHEISLYNRSTCDGGKITRTRRPAAQKQIVVNCVSWAQEEHNAAMDRLADVIEYDNANNKSGKLYVNGSYIQCRITESYKTLDREFQNSSLLNLTVWVEVPAWCKEHKYTYTPGAGTPVIGAKRYPNRYAYAYAPSSSTVQLLNPAPSKAPLRIVFYGAATNPKVYLGDITIGLNITLLEGEYAVIDQLSREVYKVSASGAKTNCFNNRYKAESIFNEIQSGTSYLSASTDLKADVFVIEQRSEPRWT